MFPFTERAILDHVSSPPCPDDWPEYGTPEFINRMEDVSSPTFEMAVFFQELDWQCFFDDSRAEGEAYANPTAVIANEFYLRMVSDAEAVMRVACSASSFAIVDRCQDREGFPHAFAAADRDSTSGELFGSPKYFSAVGGHFFQSTRHADLSWGLDCGRQTLLQELPLPFQATIFMTPDNWCLINLGVNALDATATDLSSVWSLLEYFTPFFKTKSTAIPDSPLKRSVNMPGRH